MRMSDWSSDVCSSDLNADFLVGQHAVPLTTDEFTQACRFYPIVFSAGDNPVPLALMGMNEGINKIGRASCGERVCQYVQNSVGADFLTKKQHKRQRHS